MNGHARSSFLRMGQASNELQRLTLDGAHSPSDCAPKLAYPVLLGSPFLKSNKIVIDHKLDLVSVKDDNYQLLPCLVTMILGNAPPTMALGNIPAPPPQ